MSNLAQLHDPFYNDAVPADLVKIAEAILDAAEKLPEGKKFVSIDLGALGIDSTSDLGGFNATHPFAPIHWAVWLIRQFRMETNQRFEIAPRDMLCRVRRDQKCIGCTLARVPGGEDINVFEISRENDRHILNAKVGYSFRSG